MSEKIHSPKNFENCHKIVPKNPENLNAWKNEKPDYLENLLKTEPQKPIKIYSIDIEGDEEDNTDLQSNPRKSLFSERCRISIISENAWKNFYSKPNNNGNINAPQSMKKHRNFKNIIKKIIDHCPFKLPWVVLIISVIQVITELIFYILSWTFSLAELDFLLVFKVMILSRLH